MLTGYKTYAAALGLVATGLQQIADGNAPLGVAFLCNALGFFGLRTAIRPILDALASVGVDVVIRESPAPMVAPSGSDTITSESVPSPATVTVVPR